MPTRNIVTDDGAVGNGVADDSTAFASFNTWAIAQVGTVTLTIPAGTYYIGPASAQGRRFAKGVKSLIVQGAGIGTTTITNNDNDAVIIYTASDMGVMATNSPQASARLQTVPAGATSITLVTAGDAALFSINTWALIGGYSVQSLWQYGGHGYPPNVHFFEYVYITGISGSTITFSAPLVHTYKSTWPLYDPGGVNGPDAGGPATLWVMDQGWDQEVEYQDLTIDQNKQTYSDSRSVTYRDCAFVGPYGPIPTHNMLWRAIGCDLSTCDTECDKLVREAVYDDCVLNNLVFQSSSVDLLTMTNCTVTGVLSGTPKRAVISGSTIGTFGIGTVAYGRTDEVTCTNCTFGTIAAYSLVELGAGDAGVNNVYTISDGVIRTLNTHNAVRWAIPGTYLMWGISGRSFRVLDITQDATYTYVRTTWSAGFPTAPVDEYGRLYIRVHPAPILTFTNCVGCADAIDLSQAPDGSPLYSYTKRTYDGSLANPPLVPIWGDVVTMKFNVLTPYTGVTTTVNLQNYSQLITPTNTLGGYNFPNVNLKVAGERVVSPSGVTGNQSGDSDLSLPYPSSWLSSKLLTQFIPDISAQSPAVRPSVSVEVVTKQSVGRSFTIHLV